MGKKERGGPGADFPDGEKRKDELFSQGGRALWITPVA